MRNKFKCSISPLWDVIVQCTSTTWVPTLWCTISSLKLYLNKYQSPQYVISFSSFKDNCYKQTNVFNLEIKFTCTNAQRLMVYGGMWHKTFGNLCIRNVAKLLLLFSSYLAVTTTKFGWEPFIHLFHGPWHLCVALALFSGLMFHIFFLHSLKWLLCLCFPPAAPPLETPECLWPRLQWTSCWRDMTSV